MSDPQPLLPSDDELVRILDTAFSDFAGDLSRFESAAGALVVGRHLGWKPLYIVHQHSTMKAYEKILGVSFRDILPADGPRASKSLAWDLFTKAKHSFWKVAKGEIAGAKTPDITRSASDIT